MTARGSASSKHNKEANTRREGLLSRYRAARAQTEALCRPLAIEDYGLQAMPDASPPKWHLAHTTWFFETFLLLPFAPGYRRFHPQFDHLFNSYYETVGRPFARAQRGLISRPTVEEVYAYRRHVDAAMHELIEGAGEAQWAETAERVELGVNHEQQHQELLLTDIKFNFSVNPLRPAYQSTSPETGRAAPKLTWIDFPAGIAQIGHEGPTFCFDNETPRHRVYLNAYALAARAVTNSEYLAFMEDGGYTRAELWLSDGWRAVSERQWRAPLYWERIDGGWRQFTLSGLQPLDPEAPVCHVGFYEAEAYARWSGMRLPTEAEWENAAADRTIAGNFVDSERLHPAAAQGGSGLLQIFGDVWEWTASSYAPYPGFKPLAGSLGEYNGKFMANQMVLRGGACVTPPGHLRATYRNFFYPPDRWQFSGIRLAQDR